MARDDDDILSPDDEISWLALEAGTKVLSQDGRLVGHVTHVLGDLEEDIFDGIGVRHGLIGQIMLPRSAVGTITRAAVHLTVPEAEVGQVAKVYAEERIFRAQQSGRKLRWGREEDDERF